MKIRVLLTTLAIALVGLVGPGVTAPAGATTHASDTARHACTRTSSGSCIRGGEFCPKAKKGKVGWDGSGRRYKCKGGGSHPHWRKLKAAKVHHHASGSGHACTRTSSGSCIQGGEFCKQSAYGETGYDANGTAWTCTGDSTHPHWE